ncbi:hypothetical protein AN963_09865 [Brevibacillus choshinensis]|uniref:Uncharacterized protein n=1 Tax=Brevibacillus choshinensis TaxID=54911 RepID=A0ABR5NEM9_BRECH|nr:hypothetical protein [Brevibacillus choshinensis]KQL49962.1 hypothetical protein AN963_09865 [Brevibacillus choshinensis]
MKVTLADIWVGDRAKIEYSSENSSPIGKHSNGVDAYTMKVVDAIHFEEELYEFLCNESFDRLGHVTGPLLVLDPYGDPQMLDAKTQWLFSYARAAPRTASIFLTFILRLSACVNLLPLASLNPNFNRYRPGPSPTRHFVCD